MRKRLFALLLTAALLLSLLPQTVLFASAEPYSGTCGENLEWSFDETTGTLTIIGSGAMTSGGYYNVPWNSYRDSIKTVALSDRLTSIGNCAFTGCRGLTSIAIPNSVASIGNDAFSSCTGLTSITIGNGVTSIGSSAFSGCTGLTSITIGNSVTSIGSSAFSGCTGLSSIAIDEANSVYDSRDNCNAIIETASNTMFFGCKSTVIPDSVTGIGDDAFSGCTGLTSVTIPDSVTSIGIEAFNSCTGLTSITIGNGVTSIGNYAFFRCSGLTNITIPNSVQSIGDGAFYYCSSLTSITVDEANPAYDSRNNCNAIIETASNTLFFGCKSTVIPDSVTNIGNFAFYGCTGLTSVTIPDSVTSIGIEAFNSCTGLTSVTIGNGVTSIGNYAFFRCSGLTNITIPNSVQSIGDDAFSGCTGLTSVTIGSGVTSIGNYAFFRCSGLANITIPNSVQSIGDFAFYYCSSLTSITIPNRVQSIGSSAFSDCTELTSVTIGNGVTSIGDGAFSFCSGLTNITIPNSVQSIGERAFQACSGLTSITIPDGVTSIGEGMFVECSELMNITIPNSVQSIGDFAFYGCRGLASVTIGNGVTSIGNKAFSYCTGLTSITIPKSVTSIGNQAFSFCTGQTSTGGVIFRDDTGLSHVHFLGNKPSIDSSAFYFCAIGLTLCCLPGSTGWDSYTDYPTEVWDCTAVLNCTNPTYTCNTCGEVYAVTGEYHDWSLTETITVPTCTEAGSGSYACSVCGTTKTEPIPATGHQQGALVSETGTYWEYQCLNGDHTYIVNKDSRLQAMQLTNVTAVFDDSDATYPWVFSENDSTVGANAIVSSNQGVDSSTSSTTITFTSAYEFTLSFDYKVSSESNYDKLTVKVDNTTVANAISGTTGSSYQETLPAGTHTVTLSFSKDVSAYDNDDTGYIYNITAQTVTDPKPIYDDTLKISRANLLLESDISICFYVLDSILEGWDTPYMEFSKAYYDNAGNVIGYQKETAFSYEHILMEDGLQYRLFRFKGICASEMSSAVTATLYAQKDGVVYEGMSVDYSVLTYATNMLGKTEDAKLKTLLVDLLNYGAAAQNYVGYNLNSLANANLTAEQKACATQAAPELTTCKKITENDGATVSFKTCNLVLEEKVTVNFFMRLSAYEGELNDLQMVISYTDTNGADRQITVDSSEFVREALDDDAYYGASFHQLNALQMRTVLTAEVFSKSSGECVSDTATYSIESYAYSKQKDSDNTLVNMLEAMMKYGDAAEAYFLRDE